MHESYTFRPSLSSSNNEDGNIIYHYDSWGRMDQQTISGKVYSFDYDKFDRLYHLTYPMADPSGNKWYYLWVDDAAKNIWNAAESRTSAMQSNPNWYTVGNWATLELLIR